MAARKNPGGPKSEKLWREAVLRAVKRRESGSDPQALEKLADALVAKGLEGDVTALREIGDRLDGKPRQEVEHAGDIGPSYVMVSPEPMSEEEWTAKYCSHQPTATGQKTH